MGANRGTSPSPATGWGRLIPRTRWQAVVAIVAVAAAVVMLVWIATPQDPFSAQCHHDSALYNRDVQEARNATSGAAQFVDLTAAQAVLGAEKQDCG
jgi:hypothetical protein